MLPHNCTANHGGTSAAAPLAVGMLALVLSVRPDLSYRDAQHITILGAVPIQLEDPSWQDTAGGRRYSHKFGFGKLDAYRMVDMARSWTKVRPMVSLRTQMQQVIQTIPFGEAGLISKAVISKDDVSKAYLDRLEHITVHVNISHDWRGDLDIFLESPTGILSHLGPHRLYDSSSDGFNDWTFMTVKHWEEAVAGTWKLKIYDLYNEKRTGRLVSWYMKFWGEATEAYLAAGLPTRPPAHTKNAEVFEFVIQSPSKSPNPGGSFPWLTGGFMDGWQQYVGAGVAVMVAVGLSLAAVGLVIRRYYYHVRRSRYSMDGDEEGFGGGGRYYGDRDDSRSWRDLLFFWQRGRGWGWGQRGDILHRQILDPEELEQAFALSDMEDDSDDDDYDGGGEATTTRGGYPLSVFVNNHGDAPRSIGPTTTAAKGANTATTTPAATSTTATPTTPTTTTTTTAAQVYSLEDSP